VTAKQRWRRLRDAFWVPSAIGLAMAAGAGLAVPVIDRMITDPMTLFGAFGDRSGSARALLQTIATALLTLMALSFSVTVVALQLASTQLSPRVLRTFQTDRVNQLTLALFIATPLYCLLVLLQVRESFTPRISIFVAFALAVACFVQFVAFLGRILKSLDASEVIERIRSDGQGPLERPFPGARRGGGEEGDGRAPAVPRRHGSPRILRAPAAGFLTRVDIAEVVEAAVRADGFVCQSVTVGHYVVTGDELARMWPAEALKAGEEVRSAFVLGPQRSLEQDVGFPVRQLTDVALKAMSPALNDPATATNAIAALTDLIVRFAAVEADPVVRDADGVPRYEAAMVSLDDLVRQGFEQIRLSCDEHPVVAREVASRLERIGREAAARGRPSREVERQLTLLERQPAPEPAGS